MARNFEDWLAAYVDYTEASEAPLQFHFWTGVSTIAGALRRRVWIDQRYFQWTPNFYIILVAPAGIATKSTTMSTGARLLRRVKGIHFGPSSVTWQALVESFQEASVMLPMGDGLWEPMCCITCQVSELGTFLKPKDLELVDFITDMWDGQRVAWKRKTLLHGDTTIENPWINMIGCTTPTWLRENFTEAMVGGGLASRCVFVYADAKRHLVAYPSEVVNTAEHRAFEDRLVEDLETIAALKGEYHLTSEAKEWGHAWYEYHWKGDRPAHLTDERYEGYLARKQTHLHKLAIVIAAAKRDALRIEAKDLELAEKILVSAEPSMKKVYESVAQAQGFHSLKIIMSYVEKAQRIDFRDLWTACLPSMTLKEFGEAMEALQRAGYVRVLMEADRKLVEMVRRFKGGGT